MYHNSETDKYFKAIYAKCDELKLAITDYEIARDADDKPPVTALIDVLEDKAMYLLNDIKHARIVAEAEQAQQDEEEKAKAGPDDNSGATSDVDR